MTTNPNHRFALAVHVTRTLSTEQQAKLQELLCRVIALMVSGDDDSSLRAALIDDGIDESCFTIAFSTSPPPKKQENDIYIAYTGSTFMATSICARIAFGLYRILRDGNRDDAFPEHVTVACFERRRKRRTQMSSRH